MQLDAMAGVIFSLGSQLFTRLGQVEICPTGLISSTRFHRIWKSRGMTFADYYLAAQLTVLHDASRYVPLLPAEGAGYAGVSIFLASPR